ncbi:histone-lysine N-methyltransferase SETMAR-like [Trichonephila clavipes]|nr:histone-lysine N-methyltransferase SETMAR-like [Trichonephila clavipes]
MSSRNSLQEVNVRGLMLHHDNASSHTAGLTVVSYRVLKMEANKEKIRYILQFFFDKGENSSQASEIMNGVYGANTVTANYVQFWFRRFRSGIFDAKDVPRAGRLVVENVDKITKIIDLDRHRGEAAQTVAKPGITARKVQLCIWWEWKGIIYYELLTYGQILNSDLSCQQLGRLKLVIDQEQPELANRRGVVFHQDNAGPTRL